VTVEGVEYPGSSFLFGYYGVDLANSTPQRSWLYSVVEDETDWFVLIERCGSHGFDPVGSF
jgi:hypothetical protein